MVMKRLFFVRDGALIDYSDFIYLNKNLPGMEEIPGIDSEENRLERVREFYDVDKSLFAQIQYAKKSTKDKLTRMWDLHALAGPEGFVTTQMVMNYDWSVQEFKRVQRLEAKKRKEQEQEEKELQAADAAKRARGGSISYLNSTSVRFFSFQLVPSP